jgi:putative acetyltransferase
MEKLESHLKTNGIALARLETGISQPEALGLYRRLGYVEREPFGAYAADPLSVFMEKRLDIA